MPAKPKPLTEAQFLAFLDKVLSKAINDHSLRSSIQDAVAKEIRVARDVAAFNQFCEKGSIPDATAKTVAELQDQIAATFGSDARVEIAVPEAKEGETDILGALGVEIVLPDRTITSEIKVGGGGADEGDGAPKAPFVPFPVTLPADAELVWVLARREDLGPDEAGRALAHVEDEFWGSKAGQNFQRKGGEKTFAEFIKAVPSAALLDVGLKRHYKDAEALYPMRQLDTGVSAEEFAASVGGGGGKAEKAGGKEREKKAVTRWRCRTSCFRERARAGEKLIPTVHLGEWIGRSPAHSHGWCPAMRADADGNRDGRPTTEEFGGFAAPVLPSRPEVTIHLHSGMQMDEPSDCRAGAPPDDEVKPGRRSACPTIRHGNLLNRTRL